MEEKFLYNLLNDDYISIDDLLHNNKNENRINRKDLEDYFLFKEKLIEENDDSIVNLPLKSFNSKYIFYVKGKSLVNKSIEFYSTILNDYDENKNLVTDRNFDDIINSALFSEIEGTLKIENVQTTRKQIQEVITKSVVSKEKNDVIIKNMRDAIQFIWENKPDFNKDNLLKLYNILSKDCLEEENKLKEKSYYRDDDVYINKYKGANVDKIDECMDSLFDFIKDYKDYNVDLNLIPHIAHYYIIYVHPYFDYNGRTARMISFWLNLVLGLSLKPFFISEGINEEKNLYYKAINNSRESQNDLTYFLCYIYDNCIKYSLIYKNLEEINKTLSISGDFLTKNEILYLKKILIHNPNSYFNQKMFISYSGTDMTKQNSLKILNSLSKYNILIKTKNKKNETIFKLNDKFISYSLI